MDTNDNGDVKAYSVILLLVFLGMYLVPKNHNPLVAKMPFAGSYLPGFDTKCYPGDGTDKIFWKAFKTAPDYPGLLNFFPLLDGCSPGHVAIAVRRM